MERREAILLRLRPVRDVDQLVVALSPAVGKLEFLARGTRKIESKLNPSLQLFARVMLDSVPGRRAHHLTGVEVLDPFPRLRTRLTGLAQAGFVAEVAEALSASNQAEPRLFRLVRRELLRIERARDDRLGPADVLSLSLFALRALAVTGWRPRFGQCSVCHRPLGAVAAVFAAHPYGFAHGSCARNRSLRSGSGQADADPIPLHRATRKFLYERLSQTTQPAVVPRGVAQEVDRVALTALEAVLDRALKSRRFLRMFTKERITNHESRNAESHSPDS
ncbi:MAG: DNA repair protein RecO [Candidatus Kerfeldbacteria bacterium]|nr:DNA repair protein RecO [Candidatus Kerfeldbacteria bacterium]